MNKRSRNLQRAKSKRPPYDRVLIVSEGSKTEPNYFNDIRMTFRIPSAHVVAVPSDFGTDPLNVVNFAERRAVASKAFEWVFAVFDRDDHATYAAALSKALKLDSKLKNDERRPMRFLAIPSVPCFELWLLLHYVDVHALYHRDEVIQRLRQHLVGYDKGAAGHYNATASMLGVATGRAEKLRQRFTSAGTDPFTAVDEVVTLLRGLKR